MGVLKEIKSSETVNITVKIPADLNDRINQVKETSKDLGFTVDIQKAAIKGISRVITSAEKELRELASKEKEKGESGAEKTMEPKPPKQAVEKTPPRPSARTSGKTTARPAATS